MFFALSAASPTYGRANLTCGADSCEPTRTRQGHAFNPKVRSSEHQERPSTASVVIAGMAWPPGLARTPSVIVSCRLALGRARRQWGPAGLPSTSFLIWPLCKALLSFGAACSRLLSYQSCQRSERGDSTVMSMIMSNTCPNGCWP